MFTSSVSLIDIVTFVIAVVLPLINGFITSRELSPALRGVILAGLSLVAGVLNGWLTALTNGEAFDIGRSILTFGAVFVVAVASYFGILSRPLATPAQVVIPAELVNTEAYTKGQLLTMAEEVLGEAPSSKLSKQDIADKIDYASVPVVVEQPTKSLAEIVSAHGVK